MKSIIWHYHQRRQRTAMLLLDANKHLIHPMN